VSTLLPALVSTHCTPTHAVLFAVFSFIQLTETSSIAAPSLVTRSTAKYMLENPSQHRRPRNQRPHPRLQTTAQCEVASSGILGRHCSTRKSFNGSLGNTRDFQASCWRSTQQHSHHPYRSPRSQRHSSRIFHRKTRVMDGIKTKVLNAAKRLCEEPGKPTARMARPSGSTRSSSYISWRRLGSARGLRIGLPTVLIFQR